MKENLSHTLVFEYVKMYSLASPHTETEFKTIVSVESRVVLLMSTQYSVRGRAFHITVLLFGADRTAVMTVATVEMLKVLTKSKLLAHHEQLELLWPILQTLQYQYHF